MHIWSNKGSTADCRRNKLGFVVVVVVVKINVEIYLDLDYIMLFLCENQFVWRSGPTENTSEYESIRVKSTADKVGVGEDTRGLWT